MNITLTIEATSPEKLQEAIAGLSGITPVIEVKQGTPAKEDKPKADKAPKETGSKTKDKSKSGKAPKDEKVSDSEGDEDIVEISDVDLRAKASEVGKDAEKKPLIKALLDELGVPNVTAVPQDQRSEFLQRLEEL